MAGTLTMYPFSLQSDEEIFYEEARFTLLPSWGDLDDELLTGVSFESNTGFRRGDLIYTDAVTFGMPIDFLDPTPPPRTDWEYFEFGGDQYRLRTYGLYYQYQIARSSPELCVKVRGSSSMLLLGCLGDLLRFEKREIQVATFAPDRSSP